MLVILIILIPIVALFLDLALMIKKPQVRGCVTFLVVVLALLAAFVAWVFYALAHSGIT